MKQASSGHSCHSGRGHKSQNSLGRQDRSERMLYSGQGQQSFWKHEPVVYYMACKNKKKHQKLIRVIEFTLSLSMHHFQFRHYSFQKQKQ